MAETPIPAETLVEQVDPRMLVPHPDNPRRGDVMGVARSIRDQGWWGTVIVQRSTGRILAGHTRTAAAIEVGMATVPVFWVDADDDAAKRILLADNRWADVASYDPAGLAALLREFDADQLGSMGYSSEDLAAIESLLKFQGPDPEAPPPAFPSFDENVGDDVWQVNCPQCDHRFPPPMPEKKDPRPRKSWGKTTAG